VHDAVEPAALHADVVDRCRQRPRIPDVERPVAGEGGVLCEICQCPADLTSGEDAVTLHRDPAGTPQLAPTDDRQTGCDGVVAPVEVGRLDVWPER
jgi:hypothetical protein